MAGSELRQFWREVFAAADCALEMDVPERKLFVDLQRRERPILGTALAKLLDGEHSESTIENPVSAFAAPLIDFMLEGDETADNAADHDTVVQSTFGPYRVRRELGWGGMGAVYLAERADDSYRKQVALKVLPRWRGNDRRRVQRFLEERQILANLDHPGIARLLDGGVTADGSPWFAMEYIDGEPIDRYCDERRLSIEDRLKLFCDVCAAVQYAHRNLVVHRDLKPSNIFVARNGRIALLDFGIAKLLAEHDPAVTTGEMLLTPLYSSPEQIRGEQASTSADVYALGVLLNILLTGVSPYRLSSLDSYEVARAVLEDECEQPSISALREPEGKNGTRLIPAIERANARCTTPAKLARLLRGDLDAIVIKSMAKEPGRRYVTVNEFATDVKRYLGGLTVLAQPESGLYHAGKFVRRHIVAVTMTLVAAVMVLSFTVLTAVQQSRIRAQAQRIALERDRAQRVAGNFLGIFRTVAPTEGGISPRDVLDSASARINGTLIPDPEQRASMMIAMARAYQRLGMIDRALPLLESSLALRRNMHPRSDIDLAETLDLLGASFFADGKLVRAESAYAEALSLPQRKAVTDRPNISATLSGLSAVRRAERRFAEAEQLAGKAVEMDRKGGPNARAALASSTRALAAAKADAGNINEAVSLYRAALKLMRETRAESDPEVAATIFALASALHRTGDHRAADSLIQYAVGLNQRLVAGALGTAEETFVKARSTTRAGSAPANSRIAFVSDRDGPDPDGYLGNQQVYVMNPDGSGQRRLTHDKSLDFAPAISPDGTKITFSSKRNGSEVFIMNADGTGERQLTNFTKLGLGAGESSWSPDGQRILFRTEVKPNIYVMNRDGSGVVKLTNGPRGSISPVWSPDGRKIAFSNSGEGHQQIWVMNADGSGKVRLTTNKARDQFPSWSPDGRHIAFQSDRDGNKEIYVMNADGSSVQRLTRNPSEDGHPSWSPDGRQIVFHRKVFGHGQIFVMNPDGSGVKRLTELSSVAFNGYPTWGAAPRR